MTGAKFVYPLKDNTYRVIDGDTVEVLLDMGWWTQKTVNLRLYGIDSPESRTTRAPEKQAGLMVKALVTRWLALRVKQGKWLHATSETKPKYAKRGIGLLYADDQSDCLNYFLISAGVVKSYQGKKRSWTDEELQDVIQAAQKVQQESPELA